MPPSKDQAQTISHPKGLVHFIRRIFALATQGNGLFFTWMVFLSVVALIGLRAWAQQVEGGMIHTNMTDHVSWGLYIANFTFAVGVAAGGVMMVIPAYLYKDHEMHDVVFFGELLAISAIIMAMAFVMVDLGRPDHFWHLIPGIGQFNWPLSMLSWDVIVLNVYLLLNLHICGYQLYVRFLNREPQRKWVMPVIFISIIWAFSIHTVTAFLFSGLGGRPLWNSALLAPRFLVSAFVSGPALIIVALTLVDRLTKFRIDDRPIKTLVNILRVTVVVNLFMLASELFTEFYSGGTHIVSTQYLFFGLDGHNQLVPWIWSAVGLNTAAAAMFFFPQVLKHRMFLLAACTMTFVGIWIEKGMGLIVPGFIPSALFEIVEYIPSVTEWRIAAGIWAMGLMIYTIGIKVSLPILRGEETIRS